MTLGAGTYTGYNYAPDGTVSSRTVHAVPHLSSAHYSGQQVRGSALYIRISDGLFRDTWLLVTDSMTIY